MKTDNRIGRHLFAEGVCARATLLLLAATTNLQAQYNYTTLAVPGAANTVASGISGNNIVGYYTPSNSPTKGFLYNGSTYTTLSVPGAEDTVASGIFGTNIVGSSYNVIGGLIADQYGFLCNGSSYTTLNVPGAASTVASGISGNDIVGSYGNSNGTYGFFYNGSSYTTLNVPGAEQTVALGISNTNIVGFYWNGTNEYGFVATPIPAPTVFIQPQTQTVIVGNQAVFNTTTYGTPPLSFQWLFSGTNLLDATSPTLTITNAFPVNAGLYAVIVTNVYGCVTSAPTTLTVSPLVLTAPQSPASGQFQFSFDTATGVNYAIQYSTTLTDWLPFVTFEGNGEPITIIDPTATGSNQHFYRIVLSLQ
jgi:hypothetical protein